MQELTIKKKINTDVLKGNITMAALSYPERIAMSQESLVDIGETDKSFEVKAKGDLARAQSYYELARKQVRHLELTIVIDEQPQTITSIDELMIYEEGTALVMELAANLIGGVRLGNVKSDGLDKTV